MPCHRALEIPLILEHILGFCSAKDLASCRLVSTFWKSASSTKWKSSAAFKITSNTDLVKFETFWKDTDAKNNCTNISLRDYFYYTDIKRFWTMCGSSIKILDLGPFNFIDEFAFRDLIYKLSPNLEKLTLRSITVGEPTKYDTDLLPYRRRETLEVYKAAIGEYGENWNLKSLILDNVRYHIVPWIEFLGHFPGLKFLTVIGEMVYPDQVFDALSALRKEAPEKFTLKRISVTPGLRATNKPLHTALFEVLSDPMLRLEALSITLHCDKNAEHLTSVLKGNGSSLRTMEITADSSQGQYLDPLPIFTPFPENSLNNLTKIVLHTRVFSSLTFLKFTPNLVRLAIYDFTKAKHSSMVALTSLADLQNVRLIHLKELEYTNRLPVEDLHKLIDWIPNVEMLKMTLDDHTFAVVCERWRNLVSLEVTLNSSVSESGLTGIDASDVAIINAGSQSVPLIGRKANITYLTHIRSLRMAAKPKHGLLLGRCGASFGIEQLGNLQHLRVGPRGYGFQANAAMQIWNDLHAKYRYC